MAGSLINPSVGLVVSHVNFGLSVNHCLCNLDKPNWKDGLDGILINPSVGLVVTCINFGYV